LRQRAVPRFTRPAGSSSIRRPRTSAPKPGACRSIWASISAAERTCEYAHAVSLPGGDRVGSTIEYWLLTTHDE